MATTAGTAALVAAPAAFPGNVSRYRSLRGKSVFDAGQGSVFNVYKDSVVTSSSTSSTSTSIDTDTDANTDAFASSPPPSQASTPSARDRKDGHTYGFSPLTAAEEQANLRKKTVAARRRSKSMGAAATAFAVIATANAMPGAFLLAAARSDPDLNRNEGPALAPELVPSPAPVPVAPFPDSKEEKGLALPTKVPSTVLGLKSINIPLSPTKWKSSNGHTVERNAGKPAKKQPRHVAKETYTDDSLTESTIAARKALNNRAVLKNATSKYTLIPTTTTRSNGREIERLAAERRRQEAEEAVYSANEAALQNAEADRILAECVSPGRSPREQGFSSRFRSRNLILGKFAIFTRGRKSNATESPLATPKSAAPTFYSFESTTSTSIADSSSSCPPSPSPSPLPSKTMNFIEQGGGGIVPQTDAPASASNGGERRVTVRCLSSTINLPVNTETSPVDILYSTANFTTHNIDPEACILIECYVELGLERRIRRYEHIRDIMNSWDKDYKNSLLVYPLRDESRPQDLELGSVARTQISPPGFTLQLYHSKRPGKWVKRWITLLENGQMFSSKKPDSKPTDKDSVALCHLSDFDLYSPRESETRRHLKPPKKHCIAVKSQQKTNFFSNGENFVHFFSTEDDSVNDQFCGMIHAWRSWYLVNKRLDLDKKGKSRPVTRSGTVKQGLSKSKSVKKAPSMAQLSNEDSPYRLGNFSPLLDLSHFDKPAEEFGKYRENKVVQEQLHRSKTISKSHRQQLQPLVTTPAESEFDANGLLGSIYEKRKQSEQNPATSPQVCSSPFTEGPSLLNGGVMSPTGQDNGDSRPWHPSATEHTARGRSARATTRRPGTSDGSRTKHFGQPLVNLNQNGSVPALSRRDTGGHGIKVPNGSPLINFATGGLVTMPARSNTRAGSAVPSSRSAGPLVSSSRPRSRSIAGLQPSRRMEDRPPVPPLPSRSVRRVTPVDTSRGRDPRPREPLITRAGTGTIRQ